MKKIFSILAAVLLAGGMMAIEKTYTFTDVATPSAAVADGFTFTFAKNSGSTAPTWNSNKSEARLYAKGSLTIDGGETNVITQIVYEYVVNANNKGKVPTIDGAAGETNEGTWNEESTTWSDETGDAKVIFSTSGEAGNVGFKSVTITYTVAETTNPILSANPASIDFGTVEQGADVDDAQVAVSFENLTGAVTYSALTAPFSATGSIENSGDAITISAGTDEVGDFTQTLTIQSAADNKSVEVTVHIKVNAPSRAYHHTIDFSQSEDFSSWTSSYSEHTISDADVDVVFASANKQSGTITDVPVTKGGDVELKLNAANNSFTAVRFICKQWGAKAQTITLQYSADGGENYADFDPALTSDDFEIEKVGLPAGTNAVKISFSSQDNQIGIASVSYDLASDQATAVENIEQVKVTKIIRNGQVLILHDGIEYNMLGAEVK